MDITPIGADRFEALVETVLGPEHRKFDELVEARLTDPKEEFDDLVSTEDPSHDVCRDYVDVTLEGWADRVDRDELSRGKVTLTDTKPAASTATVDLADRTVTDLWAHLFNHDDVRAALVE